MGQCFCNILFLLIKNEVKNAAGALARANKPCMITYMALASTLPQRLGIKDGQRVALLHAPSRIENRLVRHEAIRLTNSLRPSSIHVVVLFVETLQEFERRFSDVVAKMTPETSFWVVWKTRGAKTHGVSNDVVRRVGRAGGLVDNKSCVVDDGWQGMRLVVRGENRDAIAYRCEPKPSLRRTKRATNVGVGGAGLALRRRA